MIVVIADDLSGAAELAGAAMRHGLSAEVQTTFSPGTDADVVCVDTDSRLLAPADAARRVAAATHLIVAAHPAWIFKKCDSVLRGPVLAEARAAAEAAGKQRILLVPSNPSRGRTISGGIYRIAGLPLNETPFATDPTHPRRTSDVKTLLGGDLTNVLVPDTATAPEIQLQANAVDERTLPVGAADFFVALLAARTPKGPPPKPSPVAPGKKLLVCGSAAAWTRRHEEAIAAGIPVFSLPHELSASIGALRAGDSALLGIGDGAAVREVPAGELLRRLAEAVAGIVREVPVEYLLLEGGATAAAAIGTLGWTRLRAEQVADPGIGVLRPVEARAPLVVVKPGSYPWPAEFWP